MSTPKAAKTLKEPLVRLAKRNDLAPVKAWLIRLAAILLALVLLSIVLWRPFCRYLCPLGAIYGLFNPVAVYRFRIDEDRCTDCGACKAACKLDIDVRRTPNSAECVRCGACRRACPHGAIQTGGRCAAQQTAAR